MLNERRLVAVFSMVAFLTVAGSACGIARADGAAPPDVAAQPSPPAGPLRHMLRPGR